MRRQYDGNALAPRFIVYLVCAVGILGTASALEIPLSPQALSEGSDAIITATVQKKQYKLIDDARGRHIYTDVSLTVDAVLQGTISSTNIILEVVGGTLDGITEQVSFSPAFDEGERALLFLKTQPLRLMGARQGKRTIRDGTFQLGPYKLTPEGFKSALLECRSQSTTDAKLDAALSKEALSVTPRRQPAPPIQTNSVEAGQSAVAPRDSSLPRALGGGQLPPGETQSADKGSAIQVQK